MNILNKYESEIFARITSSASIYSLITVLVLCLFSSSVVAEVNQRILVLHDSINSISASGCVDVLEDPSRRLSLEEVMSPEYAQKFVANTQETPNFGRSHSAYWLRFDLINRSTFKWYLLMDFMLGDELSLYIVPETEATSYAQQLENYRRPAWTLYLPKGEKLRFYIRATNGDAIVSMPVELLSENQFLNRSNQDYLLYSAIYAAMIVLAIYNLSLYATLREFSYLNLSIHIFAMVATLHKTNPVFESLFFLGDTSAYFFSAPLFIGIGSFCLFAMQILETKIYLPKINFIFATLLFLSGALIPVTGLITKGTLLPPSLAIITILLTFIASFVRKKQGDRIAHYFFNIFWIIVFVSLPNIFVGVFIDTQWGNNNAKILAISNVLFILLLSLIQAERVRSMRENMQRIKSAGDAKDSFLASMSHELRTPLNAIFGLSTLLQLSNLDEKQNNYVKKLTASSRYMLQLIGNILDIKKIENKNFQLEKKPFVLKTVLASIHDLLHEQAQVKGLNLVFENSDIITEVICADKVRLSQVLINLLSNGIKYTQRGETRLTLEQLACSIPGSIAIRFNVIDTGIGIPADKMASLFQPFVQLHDKAGLSRDGAGLGLYISKNLVEMMGGTLEVKSMPNKGSHFFFSLLLEVGTETTLPDQEKLESEPRFLLPGTRILLVDDYELNVYIWRKLLSSIGGDVATALDGQSTILQLQQDHFDIVLIDISLPDMDGFEVTRWIRAHSQNPKVPILALTAHATAEVEQQCHDVGMNGYLSKPFELEDLYNAIKQILYKEQCLNQSQFE